MQSIRNRRVLTCLALTFAAVAVAIVLFAAGLTSPAVWVLFAVGLITALFLALQLERRNPRRSNLR